MKRTQKKLRKTRGYKRKRGNGKRCRGAGNRGGRGRAGLGKRAAQNKIKYLKDKKLGRPGSHGFISIKQRKDFHPETINVDKLDKFATKTGQTEVNLLKLGYKKLLGSGKVRNKIIVHVPQFSETAKQKIESAGGKIINE
jgi:large subunit ribosomal protein L15